MTDFETPREAVLRAENERLKAENSYLRQSLGLNTARLTPIGAVEEIELSHLPQNVTLPCVGSVRGGLSRYGNYHVLARLSHTRAQPEDLLVQYHAPAENIKANAEYAVNELFPYLHQRFIAALANAIRKPKQEVA